MYAFIYYFKKGAKKFKNLLLPIKLPYDQAIGRYIKNNMIESYAASPALFWQNRDSLKSNIGNDQYLKECLDNEKTKQCS